MPRWTDAQNSAINAKNSNILVSAAAGSGKTAVLVERVVRLITDEINPVDADRLLVVTFTNAAAAEMKSRISKSLSDIIRKQPNNSNAIRQLTLLPNAKICTIDSFCINLVREYFFKLGIAQDFKILEASQEQLIQQNTIENIIESLYEEDSEEFKKLVELLSTAKNDSELINTVKKISNYITSQPFPEEWLERSAELYSPDIEFDKSDIKACIVEDIRYQLDYAKELISSSRDSLCEVDEMFEAYSALLDNDLDVINSIYSKLDNPWNELKQAVECLSFEKAPRSPKGYDSESKRIVFANRDIYKKIVSSNLPSVLCATSEEIDLDNAYLYPVFKSLIELINRYNSELQEAKNELNSYSFSDIEHFAIKLLFYKDENGDIKKTDLAREYEDNFYEILVDEYQDTNTAQDTLFEMLSNGKNRFMVGDVKQSIYRFRLAMPQIFTDKKNAYTPYSENSAEVNQKIILDMNFRSRDGICAFTNFLFSKIMSKKVGELDYTNEEYLNAGAEYNQSDVPCVSLNLVETPKGENADEFEARQVAGFILDKIKAGETVKDGDSVRRLEFKDFAVLFRSPKNRLHIFSKVFSEFGIPVISNNKVNLFENNEVSVLLSFLRIIDNPVQDIPLLAVLFSVFYGYTADEIAKARAEFKSGSLYSAIANDRSTFGKLLDDLERFKGYAASMSVESFIRQLLSETSYLSIISAMDNQEQRKENVMKLVELTKGFDRGESVGLTAFIRYVDAVIESGANIESADVTGVGENCVSLMSIHKSKGLEFPVVILAGASHRYNNDDLYASVLLNERYGVGLKVNNEAGLYRYNSAQYNCVKNVNTYASMSENLRVLYVAVTRAKEQFAAFCSFSDVATHVNNVSAKLSGRKIPSAAVKSITNDADLILLSCLLHSDAGKLRALCENSVSAEADSGFALAVSIIDKDRFAAETQEINVPANAETVKAIEDKLAFNYDRSSLSAFSSKRTASSLDDKEQSFKYFASSRPAFLYGDKLTSAQKGTAMHEFMQHCNYESARDDLEAEIKRLTEYSFITQKQADSLDRKKLSDFFGSDFAKRMFNSDALYRELKVSAFVPVNELEDTEFTDGVLVQGIADCVFEENGELVLVDYKTDYVSDEQELLNLYKNQLAFYKRAVSKTLSKPVKEAMLYSFSLSKPCVYK